MDSDDTAATALSMLAAVSCRGHVHLVVGSGPLAASRCRQSVRAGARPIVVAPAAAPAASVDGTPGSPLRALVDEGLVRWQMRTLEDTDLFTLGRNEVGGVVDAVFVTIGPDEPLAAHLSRLCKRNRIPVNVVDAPDLCSFTLLSAHTDGPLQVGVTTNGRGCKLASRIRRDIAASLPAGLGAACDRLGDIRRAVQDADHRALGHLEDSLGQAAHFNRLVAEGDTKDRRMRWLAQVCEYWPLKRLAALSDDDVSQILRAAPDGRDYPDTVSGNGAGAGVADTEHYHLPAPSPGRIILAGSGPGHPDLLTRATHQAIQCADLVLADKLVPSAVLELVPRRTPVHIARKFPGNAERAQEELLEAALAAVRRGQIVLRLKQGDPFIYGRGGEEVRYFASRGLRDRLTVLPGITSALSAPLFAAVPCTQRDVADQVLICTGTGQKGRSPAPPEFVPSRTVVFLMALHRISDLVRELTTPVELTEDLGPASKREEPQGRETGDVAALTGPVTPSPAPQNGAAASPGRERALWPGDTPCAVVERASCPDQRVIRTTLRFVSEAIEAEGSRPPGLLVVGAACEALCQPLRQKSWVVEEGFSGLDLGQD